MARLKNQRLLDAVSTRVKQLRTEREITLEVFFHDTGIHLARLEAGRSNVTLSTLEAVCRYFGVTLSEFFSVGFTDVAPIDTKQL
ncbi:helix-turn-helix transcriptional regulator [Pontibacter sp. Tf4]|uniref:helix-turn-helix domain-containing protein n=1 Tax=Pontibacter sp. Tf4 TaxID=2761620 RepID=UPI0016253C82|nr:helix-turn-helix transcriptional regulator [Pontibacter sp. Tf4]MBB6612560.1 helix-turn-helix transcriptional regulator [Pontibacter sp. Tf4]